MCARVPSRNGCRPSSAGGASRMSNRVPQAAPPTGRWSVALRVCVHQAGGGLCGQQHGRGAREVAWVGPLTCDGIWAAPLLHAAGVSEVARKAAVETTSDTQPRRRACPARTSMHATPHMHAGNAGATDPWPVQCPIDPGRPSELQPHMFTEAQTVTEMHQGLLLRAFDRNAVVWKRGQTCTFILWYVSRGPTGKEGD